MSTTSKQVSQHISDYFEYKNLISFNDFPVQFSMLIVLYMYASTSKI